MPRKRIVKAGRPPAKGGLPERRPGEPFSLLATLRRARKPLTVSEVADLLSVAPQTIYDQIDKGKIPVIDCGLDIVRIDPAGWLFKLEKKNKHLQPSADELQAA